MATWTEKDGDITIDLPGFDDWTSYVDRSGFTPERSLIVRHDEAEEAWAVAGCRSKRPSSDLCVLPSTAPHIVLEVKDASNPRSQPKDQRRFIKALLDEQGNEKGAFARKRLIPCYLTAVEFIAWLTGMQGVHYPFYLLLETPVRLDAAQLGTLISDMQRALAQVLPYDWHLRKIAVVDLSEWNSLFPKYPALRLSAQEGQA